MKQDGGAYRNPRWQEERITPGTQAYGCEWRDPSHAENRDNHLFLLNVKKSIQKSINRYLQCPVPKQHSPYGLPPS